MERLTDDMNGFQYGMKACDNCKHEYVCKDGHISDCKAMDKVIQKLGVYEELEENGMYPTIGNELLLEIKKYIECCELAQSVYECGSGVSLEEIIAEDSMPSVYDEILKLLYKPVVGRQING